MDRFDQAYTLDKVTHPIIKNNKKGYKSRIEKCITGEKSVGKYQEKENGNFPPYQSPKVAAIRVLLKEKERRH